MIDRKNDLAIENEKLRKENLELRKEEGTLFGFLVCTEIKVLLGIPA
ncbi:hypothetical protein [Aerococcus agrisoli]